MTTKTVTNETTKPQDTPVIVNQDTLSDLVEAGKTALNTGDLRGALMNFEKSVQLFPNSPEGHNNLGAMYSSLGEFKKAEYCFDKVLEILPKNPNILYNRGIVRTRLEKFDLAREDFIAVSKITPDDPDNFNNLGVTAFMQGHLDAARKYFRKALKINPTYTNALINLCDVEESDGHLDKAVKLCEKFLTNNHDLEVRRKHLDLLSKGCQHALEKASRAAENLLGSDTSNASTRTQLGKLTQAKAALLDGPTF